MCLIKKCKLLSKCKYSVFHVFIGAFLQQARALPHVGERLADKIYEIVTSGRLRRLENVDHEKENVIKMFTNIHGVGQVIAQQFYAQVEKI